MDSQKIIWVMYMIVMMYVMLLLQYHDNIRLFSVVQKYIGNTKRF